MSAKISHEVKGLKTRDTKLTEEINSLQAELNRLNEEMSVKVSARQSVRSRMKAIEDEVKRADQKIIVTEHAMLRYCERVLGLDLEQVAKEVAPDTVQAMAKKLGNGTYPAQGFKVKVVNGSVVTVI